MWFSPVNDKNFVLVFVVIAQCGLLWYWWRSADIDPRSIFLDTPVALLALWPEVERVTLGCTETRPVCEACQAQQQHKLFLENPARRHREVERLVIIFDKAAIQNPLIAEVNLPIDALANRTPCLRMRPGIPSSFGCLRFYVAHAGQSQIEEQLSPGCEVRMDRAERADLGRLGGKHREGIRGDENSREPLLVVERFKILNRDATRDVIDSLLGSFPRQRGEHGA